MNTKISFDLNHLYIITDFDHTLTTKNSQNCWGIISTIPNISKEYIKQSKENNDLYFPIEQDDSINNDIKNKMMKKWYEEHAKMLIKYNLKEKDINEASQNDSIILREGVIEFLEFTNKNNIPVIIISAGISNIIEGVLKKHNCFFNNVYVTSNIFKFENGKLKSLRNKIIHSLNKGKIDIPTKIKEIIKEKDEVIIIGDNIDDSKVKIKENKKSLKIGFLNYEDNNKFNNFKKHFDIVYNKDASLLKIIELINNKKA